MAIPKENASYCDVAYWDDRYQTEVTYDWLLPYHTYAHLISRHVKKTDRILMLGCGNSPLSELLFKDGFKNIENIDYSRVVINNMASHCDDCAQMKWHVMDATQLQFPDSSFDVVIEKATLDAMMVKEKDPWTISESTQILVTKVLKEVNSEFCCTAVMPQITAVVENVFIGHVEGYFSLKVVRLVQGPNGSCDRRSLGDQLVLINLVG